MQDAPPSPQEARERAAVVAEALSWERTPWRHQGRVKGAGVDCANLILAGYEAQGLIDHIEPGNYPRDWHVHKDQERFLRFVPSFAVEVPEITGPGDLVLAKIGRRVFSHGLIVVDWPVCVHAWIKAGMVIRSDITAEPDFEGVALKFFTHRNWVR